MTGLRQLINSKILKSRIIAAFFMSRSCNFVVAICSTVLFLWTFYDIIVV